MLTIKDLIREAVCDLCEKTKDCCVVQLADQKTGDTILCWRCLQRQASMKARSMKPRPAPEPKATKPENKLEGKADAKHAEPKPPLGVPANGPVAVGK